ncbi:hypothetical protein DL98DRAFT_435397, partial [Cadophora sp. DSE1049]
EGVIFFEWLKCGRFYKNISLLVVLKTILYKTWQASNFPLLRRVLELLERLDRNTWFLIKKKKPGKYRLINLIIMFNAVI